MSKGWAIVWIILVFVLAAILFQPAKTPDGAPTVENSQSHEVPFHPNAVAVVVSHSGISTVPGTIVCPDLATVQLMFHLYNEAWEDGMQDQMTNGESRKIRGPSASTPNPSNYGCSLLAPGTPVQVNNPDAFTTGIPQITAKLPDRTYIQGITLPSMLFVENVKEKQ